MVSCLTSTSQGHVFFTFCNSNTYESLEITAITRISEFYSLSKLILNSCKSQMGHTFKCWLILSRKTTEQTAAVKQTQKCRDEICRPTSGVCPLSLLSVSPLPKSPDACKVQKPQRQTEAIADEIWHKTNQKETGYAPHLGRRSRRTAQLLEGLPPASAPRWNPENTDTCSFRTRCSAGLFWTPQGGFLSSFPVRNISSALEHFLRWYPWSLWRVSFSSNSSNV